MNKLVEYRNWVFEVDYQRTYEVYKQNEKGRPESCGCNNCRNFLVNRKQIYPVEFKNLLVELGIDYKKESEIYHIYRAENGKHLYGGWFHFKGKIKEGKDCKIETPNGGNTIDTINLNKDFQIGFLKDNSLTFFDKEEREELIQIEFYALSNWVIDKSLESE